MIIQGCHDRLVFISSCNLLNLSSISDISADLSK